jgi:ribonuclease HI
VFVMTLIYTDGACSGNPGPGGWAWAIAPDGAVHGVGGEPHTTNQRMEIMAVLQALRSNDGQLTIVSDSTYVVNCFRDRWWVRWQANGWRNSKKQPVANIDLWQPLIELYKQRQPSFQWVKGHSGDVMNDIVDRLAVVAALGPFTAAAEPNPPASPAQTSLF